jgi:hypothetical protein
MTVDQIVGYLESGITLVTPVFFIIVLLALLRVLHLLDITMNTLVYLQIRIERIEKATGAAEVGKDGQPKPTA